MFNLTTSFCIGRVASNELLNYAICKRNEGPNLDRTQSNHLPPALFPAVLSDFHVLCEVQVGVADSGDCGLVRRRRWPDRREIQRAFFARSLSRPHRRYAFALFFLCR